jgi:hypothetical protein
MDETVRAVDETLSRMDETVRHMDAGARRADAELWVAVTAAGAAAPADPGEYDFVTLDSRTPHTMEFDARGRRVAGGSKLNSVLMLRHMDTSRLRRYLAARLWASAAGLRSARCADRALRTLETALFCLENCKVRKMRKVRNCARPRFAHLDRAGAERDRRTGAANREPVSGKG